MNLVYTIAIFLVYFLILPLLWYKFLYNQLEEEKWGKWLIFFICFSIGPFTLPILFYYFQIFFPEYTYSTHLINISLIISISIFLSIIFVKIDHLNEYKFHFPYIPKMQSGDKLLILLIFLSLIFTSIQLLFFQSTGVDELLYAAEIKLNSIERQISSLYNGNFTVLGNIHFKYNTAIRPGLIVFGSSLQTILPNIPADFILRFISFYYLILFIALLFSVIYKTKKNLTSSLITVFFILYSWIFIKNILFGGKEILIFFFALLSLVIVFHFKKRPNFIWSLIVGMITGINIFLNFHGFIISSLIILTLIIYFITSKRNFTELIKPLFIILITLIIFSGKEISYNMSFFLGHSSFTFLSKTSPYQQQISTFSPEIYKEYSQYEQETLKDMRKLPNYFISMAMTNHIKGKLQSFTQIGYYGFTFWLALVLFIINLKSLLRQTGFKFMLLFLTLYILILFDPFNLKLHRYSFVAETSTKYTTFIMIFAALLIGYCWSTVNNIISKLLKNKILLPTVFILIGITLFISKDYIVNEFLNISPLIFRLYKDIGSYNSPMRTIITTASTLLILTGVIKLLNLILGKEESIINHISASLYLLSILFLTTIFPFMAFSPGKVDYIDQFRLLFSSRKIKLVSSINEGNIFSATYYLNERKVKEPVLSLLYEPVYYAEFPIYTIEHLFPINPPYICLPNDHINVCPIYIGYLLFSSKHQIDKHPFFQRFGVQLNNDKNSGLIKEIYNSGDIKIWKFL